MPSIAWMPFWEIGLGAVMLIVIMVVHGAGMFIVQHRHERYRRSGSPMSEHVTRSMLLATLVLGLMTTHIVEILLWAIALFSVGALPDLRTAFYFAGGYYTTVGVEGVQLPFEWRLLGSVIAMSGLFAFGWTTGVMAHIVSGFYARPDPRSRDTAVK